MALRAPEVKQLEERAGCHFCKPLGLCCGGGRHLDGIFAEREESLLPPSPRDQSLIRLCQCHQCCWSRQGVCGKPGWLWVCAVAPGAF